MIVWAKLPTGKVFHGWDYKWRWQRNLNSLCGMWRKKNDIGGWPMGRKCKTCTRMWGYTHKRPPPM